MNNKLVKSKGQRSLQPHALSVQHVHGDIYSVKQ